jgi:hypothetical protein
VPQKKKKKRKKKWFLCPVGSGDQGSGLLAGRVVQMVEYLLSKHEALNSSPSTEKKEKKKKKDSSL